MKKSGIKQGLNRRITLIMLIMMLLMAISVGVVSYTAMRTTYLRFYNERAQELVHIVADSTDWEKLEHYVKTGEFDDYSAELFAFYDSVKSNFSTAGYLYLFVPGETSLTYLYEARTPDDDPADIAKWGQDFEYTEYEYTYLVPDVKAGKAHEDVTLMASVEFGAGLETWAPVFDKDGKLQAMVEIDYLIPDIENNLNSIEIRIIPAFLLLITIVLVLTLRFLKVNVISPIERLNRSVIDYNHGELNLNIDKFKKDDEIKNLATSFGDMTARIEAYTNQVARVTAEKERIGAELSVARQIQEDMLPNRFPAFPDRKEFDIMATMEPAKDIGGNFYDFFLIDDDHLGLVIGDVAGKGVPAALFMVMVKTLIKNRALQGFSPAEVLQSVSEQMLESDAADMFAMSWFGIVELSTGKGIAANAGEEHPALRRAGKKFELQIYKHNPGIAVMEGVRFRDHGFQLMPGDTLFVYTDGVTDRVNEKEELFGVNRIVEALNRAPDASPSVLLQSMKQILHDFSKETPQNEDTTMLALKYYGPKGETGDWS